MNAPRTLTDIITQHGYILEVDRDELEWGDFLFDDHQCHMIAEEWVINGGTPENFRAADELIAKLIENGFEQDDDEPREYAFARQWREAGGDVFDFWRLLVMIEGHVFSAMPWSYQKAVICKKRD